MCNAAFAQQRTLNPGTAWLVRAWPDIGIWVCWEMAVSAADRGDRLGPHISNVISFISSPTPMRQVHPNERTLPTLIG
jgi:hypothetical protein